MVPNGAARLNERPVWSEASNNGNGENGRKAAGRLGMAVTGTAASERVRRKADATVKPVPTHLAVQENSSPIPKVHLGHGPAARGRKGQG